MTSRQVIVVATVCLDAANSSHCEHQQTEENSLYVIIIISRIRIMFVSSCVPSDSNVTDSAGQVVVKGVEEEVRNGICLRKKSKKIVKK